MIQHMQISKSNKITQMDKNHMIISTDAEKASNKSQHGAIIKDLKMSKVSLLHSHRLGPSDECQGPG